MGGTEVHPALHLLDIFLGVFDHLDCLDPLLLEVGLRLLDFLLLDLDPAVDLLLLGREGAR